MSLLDSPVDPAALRRARSLLRPPERRDNPAAAVAAAALFAFAGMGLAVTVITAPPVVHGK
jgi:hypothetical protein